METTMYKCAFPATDKVIETNCCLTKVALIVALYVQQLQKKEVIVPFFYYYFYGRI